MSAAGAICVAIILRQPGCINGCCLLSGIAAPAWAFLKCLSMFPVSEERQWQSMQQNPNNDGFLVVISLMRTMRGDAQGASVCDTSSPSSAVLLRLARSDAVTGVNKGVVWFLLFFGQSIWCLCMPSRFTYFLLHPWNAQPKHKCVPFVRWLGLSVPRYSKTVALPFCS